MDITLTLLGEMITFAILIWFTRKFIVPPLLDAIETRQATIAKGIEEAKQAKIIRRKAEEESREKEAQLRAEHKQLRDQAQSDINALRDKARQAAKDEKDQIVAMAQNEIKAERSKVQDALYAEQESLIKAALMRLLPQLTNDEETDRTIDQFIQSQTQG